MRANIHALTLTRSARRFTALYSDVQIQLFAKSCVRALGSLNSPLQVLQVNG